VALINSAKTAFAANAAVITTMVYATW